MSKRVLLVFCVIILVAFAGCLGGSGEDKKPKPPELTMKHGTLEMISGWADDDGNEHASVSIPLNLNNTNIVSLELTINVQDSNAENSETDQGSDPDQITVTITGGNSTEMQEGMTPFTASFKFQAPGSADMETMEYLGQGWTVQIDAALGGGKPRFFFGFIIWIDQGFYYEVTGQYSYMAEEVSM